MALAEGMALVFAENIIECAMVGTYAGKPHVNVLHLYNDEGAQSDAAKVQDLVNNWQDHIMGLSLSSEFVFTECRWRSIDPSDNNNGTIPADPIKPVSGSYTGTALPPNTCLLIKKSSLNRPRGRRDGRFYLSGVPEIWVRNDGFVEADARATVQTALDSFVTGVNDDQWGVGGGSGLAVLETTPASRLKGTTVVNLDSRPIIALTVDATAATQRDRMR